MMTLIHGLMGIAFILMLLVLILVLLNVVKIAFEALIGRN